MPQQAVTYTNRLINETSPYLLQHAHNPVDWYPWSDEALERAEEENRPIFLSIGYSACHWCHVMAHESFEDEEIAEFLNEHFVSVKVDREERPDLDEIYMAAVQIMTGGGGWPLSIFLTPELKPFYGGTYFPAKDTPGTPGFLSILHSTLTSWEEHREELETNAHAVAAVVRRHLAGDMCREHEFDEALFTRAMVDLQAAHDPWEGGFGGTPKFPPVSILSFLLRRYVRMHDTHTLNMVLLTLNKMAAGGIYDQLGGGFHRYATDNRWLIPHFEKMLYDNAQLARVYLEAWQLTHNSLYERVARDTLTYVLRDLALPEGVFCSAEDADSGGLEGMYYLWSRETIEAALGAERAEIFCTYYGIRSEGNFFSNEPYHVRLNILHAEHTDEEVAESLQMTPVDLRDMIEACRMILLMKRNHRIRPNRDDKVITAWNGLMISALALGWNTLRDQRFLDAAQEAAAFILTRMMPNGLLMRVYRSGESHQPAFLDDYAFLTAALLDLYESTFDTRYLDTAEMLATKMIEHFWDQADGGFFYTPSDHLHLIARAKPFIDRAEPSPNAVAALDLLRLGRLLDKKEYKEKAATIITSQKSTIAHTPRTYLHLLMAADYMTAPSLEIAVVGKNIGRETMTADTAALCATLRRLFLPHKILTGYDPENLDSAIVAERIPILRGKGLVHGAAAVYLCRNQVCLPPETDPMVLQERLERET